MRIGPWGDMTLGGMLLPNPLLRQDDMERAASDPLLQSALDALRSTEGLRSVIICGDGTSWDFGTWAEGVLDGMVEA